MVDTVLTGVATQGFASRAEFLFTLPEYNVQCGATFRNPGLEFTVASAENIMGSLVNQSDSDNFYFCQYSVIHNRFSLMKRESGVDTELDSVYVEIDPQFEVVHYTVILDINHTVGSIAAKLIQEEISYSTYLGEEITPPDATTTVLAELQTGSGLTLTPGGKTGWFMTQYATGV